jgi:hypothetical protein
MKKVILLLSAAYLNGNAFVDAGATVGIGTDKHEITEERAVDIEKGLRGKKMRRMPMLTMTATASARSPSKS